jgi:hypothetical protein
MRRAGLTVEATPDEPAPQRHIRVHYVRLYRRRKPIASLEKLSRVPARIPKWWAGTREPT